MPEKPLSRAEVLQVAYLWVETCSGMAFAIERLIRWAMIKRPVPEEDLVYLFDSLETLEKRLRSVSGDDTLMLFPPASPIGAELARRRKP